jgi:ketosteroid isomerase-like protein
MSGENVEVVQKMVEAFERGDYEAALESLDTDVEWSNRLYPVAEVSVRGRDAVREAFGRWMASWDAFHSQALEFIDAGERVIEVYRESARGRASGGEVQLTAAVVYEVRDRKIVRAETYPSRDAAFEAVGLGDSS